MAGGIKGVANVKKKKVLRDADRVIHNNFQTKSFNSAMNGRLHFSQVSTHSPLFYRTCNHYGRGLHYVFNTAKL